MKDIIKNIYNNVFFRMFLFVLLFFLTITVTILLYMGAILFEEMDSLIHIFSFITLILSNIVLLIFNLDVTKTFNMPIKYILVAIPFIFLLIFYEKFNLNEIMSISYYIHTSICILLFAFILIWMFGFIRKKLQREITKQIIIFISFILTLFLYLPFGIFVQSSVLSESLFFYSFIFIEKNIIWILTARLFGINLFENIVRKKAIITYFILEYIVYFSYLYGKDEEFFYYDVRNDSILQILQFVFPTLIAIYLIIYTIFFVIEKRKQKELSDI